MKTKNNEANVNVLVPLIGTIVQFDPQGNRGRGFGIAWFQIGNTTISCSLSLLTGPRIVKTGTKSPFFNGGNVDTLPGKTDQIVAHMDADGHVTVWAHQADWQAAKKLIAGRIQTHAANSTRFMANFVPKAIAAVTKKKSVAMPKSTKLKPFSTVIFSTTCVAGPVVQPQLQAA